MTQGVTALLLLATTSRKRPFYSIKWLLSSLTCSSLYFAHFRLKMDPKIVSYNITFTKKWFFMPSFHLFTQIRIILDYHVWDHFCTKRNLNKQIWVFWAPVFEKKSNWIRKHFFYLFISVAHEPRLGSVLAWALDQKAWLGSARAIFQKARIEKRIGKTSL